MIFAVVRSIAAHCAVIAVLAFACGASQTNDVPVTKRHAVQLAQGYLHIEDAASYRVVVSVSMVTAQTHNTYRVLSRETKREAWVVSFDVPSAQGASRVVYVDKINGEILGGFSSK